MMQEPPLVLVTGAGGFVGRRLVSWLITNGFRVRPTAPPDEANLPHGNAVRVKAIGAGTDWSPALNNADVVIHLAARVHILNETASDPLHAFRLVNTHSTECLARQAVQAGVRRLVFVSTIGVHGPTTPIDQPLTEDAPIRPYNAYAQSKWEAEQVLREIEADTGLEVVIVRPPLIYGPGAPGNFGRLLQWVVRGVPLPLGLTRNRRSLISLANLVDFLGVCTTHPQAAGRTFLVSDNEDLSTTELVRRLACAFNRPARLIPVPEKLARIVARLIRHEQIVDQLWGSLVLEMSYARKQLAWLPGVTVNEALQEIAQYYPSEYIDPSDRDC
jgi:nucleoside-diphosphate-sugar epimerase